MRRIASLWILLHLLLLPLSAQEVLPQDTSSVVIGEGDELAPMDDIDVKAIGIPEWLTSHFVNDTLYINCESEALPRKLVVKTNDTDIVYRLVPQFMMGDTSLLHHHPADSLYNYIWTDNHINPYGTLFDSLKDDVHIPMKGFRVPAPGYITSHYGWRRYRMHKGVDIKVLIGDSVRAAWDGQVRIVGWDPRGYGYFVVMRHDNGLETIYGHLSRPLVEEYEKIYAGEVIGLGGNTGRSTGSHLHFETRFLGNAINPEELIDFNTGQPKKDEHVIGIKAIQQAKAEQAAMRWHTVRQGDTLSGIAKRYHTTVKRLCQLNKIKETSILRLGQKIRVN
jgi:hypothetical protein